VQAALPSMTANPIPSRNRAPHQRCLSITFKPHAQIGEACPLAADTLRLGSAQRSWGTIKPPGRDACGPVVGGDGKRFANYAFRSDRNH
jgi:hypothetical protein